MPSEGHPSGSIVAGVRILIYFLAEKLKYVQATAPVLQQSVHLLRKGKRI